MLTRALYLAAGWFTISLVVMMLGGTRPYDEPPEVVEATLRALAALDYPAYEVLVVDNNTPEEKTWRPIEKLCRELGPRFRFMHLANWPGFKSGALNFALTQTSPSAELVGVVDADYQVSPLFLREMVPAFTDPQVAFRPRRITGITNRDPIRRRCITRTNISSRCPWRSATSATRSSSLGRWA